MFVSFRVRRYVGWVLAGLLALFILLVVLHRSVSTVSGDLAGEEEVGASADQIFICPDR